MTLNLTQPLSGAGHGPPRTRLTLEHVGLMDAEIRSKHHDGWSHILTELAGLLD